jgi:hypothetical protein
MKLKDAMDVHVQRFDTLTRSLTAATPRRSLLAASTAGLLAGGIESEAKKKRNRKRKQKNNRKKESGETRADAICPGPTDNVGVALNVGGNRAAQTFTALTSGRLVQAELLIAATGTESADLILQLRDIDADGVPTAEVLAETSVASSDVPPRGEHCRLLVYQSAPGDEARVRARPLQAGGAQHLLERARHRQL